jgi:hypothetical protein
MTRLTYHGIVLTSHEWKGFLDPSRQLSSAIRSMAEQLLEKSLNGLFSQSRELNVGNVNIIERGSSFRRIRNFYSKKLFKESIKSQNRRSEYLWFVRGNPCVLYLLVV